MKPTIFVVDDQPENFSVIEILLFEEDYTLKFLDGGQALLTALQYQQPDLILLDIMMPEPDGFQICQRLKANPLWCQIPIIAVTALSDQSDLEACLRAGADDFISKPVKGTELRARVRSMLRIKQQYDRLQGLVELQDDLSHMMVHDLRSPLTSIAMSGAVLERVCSEERQQKQVKRISASIQRLQCMIDSVLMLSKLRSEQLTLQPQTSKLSTIAHDAIEDLRLFAEQRVLTIQTDFPSIETRLKVDVLLIRRVIDNLLSNAIKFSPPETTVLLRIDFPEDNRARLQIFDQGPGVSETLRNRIFQKFETDLSMSGVKQTGLGLAFCKMAIEAHGGRVSVASNEPQGSVFAMELDCDPELVSI